MSQYIVLSSNYRDRLLYPNPADFIVPYGVVNNPNVNFYDVFNTRNPISFGLPIFNTMWTNVYIDYDTVNDVNRFATTIVGGTAMRPKLSSESLNLLLRIDKSPTVTSFDISQPISTSTNILKNYILEVTIGDNTYQRRITQFDPITMDAMLNQPLPQFILGNCFIKHPLADENVQNLQQSIFIGGDFESLNAVRTVDKSLFLYNINTNEIEEVDTFDFTTGIAKLKKPFTERVELTDQYMVTSPAKPIHSGSLYLFNHGKYYQTIPNDIQISQKGKGYTRGQKVILRSKEEIGNGSDYFHTFEVTDADQNGQFGGLEIRNPQQQVIKLGVAYSVLLLNDQNIIPLAETAVFTVITTSQIFCVELNNYKQTDIYKFYGKYFYPIILSPQYQIINEAIVLQPNNTINPESENVPLTLLESQSILGTMGIRTIVPYKDNLVFIVTQKYTNVTKLDYLAELVEKGVEPPSYMNGITNFLILPFSEEGVTPLNFSGSLIPHTNMRCYGLRIINLILPNKILSIGEGLLTSSYPYVFVEIVNESNPTGGNYFQIVSNNPFSQKASFICSISDVSNPETSPFIKLNSDGAHQIVKFSPNDNLRIRISLPNGATFQTDETDYHVPSLPNPLLQTTIVFHAEPM